MNAPNDWPAEPVSVTSIVPVGRPFSPWRMVTSWPSMVPTARSVLRIGRSIATVLAVLERVRPLADQLAGRSASRARASGCARLVRGSSSANSGPTRIGREVEAVGLPVLDRAVDVQQLAVPDRLLEAAEAELGEVLAHLLGEELEEVDDELGLAGEPCAQLGVLGRDAHRAGVEVADAHQDAARHDERRRREAELLGAEQRADDDVAAGLHLAVDLHDDAVAHAVEHERLLGLGEAELPRRAGVLERVERARAGAAVVAGDEDDIGQRLRRRRRRPRRCPTGSRA